MSSIFGGEHTQQSSGNLAYPTLSKALGGTVNQVGQAGTQLGNLLGLNGVQSQNTGFDNWRKSTGYQFGLDQGVKSITGNAATQGLLNSGATARALDTYGQNYADTQYGNYFGQLKDLMGLGLQGAGVLGASGNVSQGTGSKSNGMGGFIGSLLGK